MPQRRTWDVVREALLKVFRLQRQDISLLTWAPKHRHLRTTLNDLMAAAVVTSLLVPQALAYALLAGVDPVYGLYSSIFPVAAFGLLTSCSQISPGPNA